MYFNGFVEVLLHLQKGHTGEYCFCTSKCFYTLQYALELKDMNEIASDSSHVSITI